MKKFKFSSLIILCVFAVQFVSGQIIIRRDDPTGGTPTVNGMSSLSKTKTSSSISSSSYIPVTANVVGTELIVDFTSTVGTAYVSVVDHSGNVVYQTVVDTFSTSEVIIPVDELSSGKYSLKISYGTTKLTGDFQL